MKSLVLLAIISLSLTACDQHHEKSETLNEVDSPSNYHLKLIQNASGDWGYQIFNNEQLYINQPHIPAVPGNNGFKNAEQAETIGQFMIYKLEQGIVPPSVSIHELDSLGVLN